MDRRDIDSPYLLGQYLLGGMSTDCTGGRNVYSFLVVVDVQSVSEMTRIQY